MINSTAAFIILYQIQFFLMQPLCTVYIQLPYWTERGFHDIERYLIPVWEMDDADDWCGMQVVLIGGSHCGLCSSWRLELIGIPWHYAEGVQMCEEEKVINYSNGVALNGKRQSEGEIDKLGYILTCMHAWKGEWSQVFLTIFSLRWLGIQMYLHACICQILFDIITIHI